MKLRALIPLAALAAIAVSGCGSDGAARTAASPLTPSAVAVEYSTAAFSCGDAGAGRRYDLSWSPNRDRSREWHVAYELGPNVDCRAAPPPDLHPIRLWQEADQAQVKVVAPSAPRVFPPAVLHLDRIDGRWLVNVSESTPIRGAS